MFLYQIRTSSNWAGWQLFFFHWWTVMSLKIMKRGSLCLNVLLLNRNVFQRESPGVGKKLWKRGLCLWVKTAIEIARYWHLVFTNSPKTSHLPKSVWGVGRFDMTELQSFLFWLRVARWELAWALLPQAVHHLEVHLAVKEEKITLEFLQIVTG